MTKAKKLTILASLFLGATVLGSMSASAMPLSNMATSVQPEMVTKNLVEKTGKKRRNLLLGLGAGALLGGIIVNENNKKRRRYRERPVRQYRARYEPWSDAWYDDCFRRYRSFNPDTGYFRAYSGRYVFCR